MKSEHKLDRFRINHGEDALIKKWRDLYDEHPNQGLEMINDPDIHFPTLYALKDELDIKNNALSYRIRIGLYHIHNVLNDYKINFSEPYDPIEHYDQHLDCYQWMVSTGGSYLPSNHYNLIIDLACMQLFKFYNEGNLAELVNLIFHRNRNDYHTHYLINLLYDSPDPKWILYVSRFFYSTFNDQKFARKILHFIPGITDAKTPSEAVDLAEEWYETNCDYLLFTGETNDTNHAPVPFVVHYSAKYIGKSIDPVTGRFIAPLNQQDHDKRMSFAQLRIEIQQLLATTSCKKKRTDRKEWKKWLSQPLSKQLSEHNINISCCD